MIDSIRRAAIVSMSAIAWTLSPVAWAQTDGAYGTWKLNVAKSTFKPGPAPKDATVKFEASGKGVKSWQEMTAADGAKSSGGYTASYDGKDYPLTGSQAIDTVALKMTDKNTVERVDKKGGKVVQTFVRKLSPDGKTMTVTQKAKNARGEAVENTMVFERQK